MKLLLYKELPVVSFENETDFYLWLSEHHSTDQPFWLRFFKKASKKKTISYTNAVDVLLCWGWIDGLLNKYDDESYVVRISPRRPKSVWSRVNVEKVEKLIIEGKMQPEGLAKVDAAKNDGRWDAAYAGSGTIDVSESFKELLALHPDAKKYYESLSKTEMYPFAFRIATAVGEDRRRGVEQKLLERLKEKRKF